MKNNLKNKTINGLLWMFSGSVVQAILQVIVLMVLSRLIAPEDFGVINAALIVISFSTVFSMLGVGPAIIQKKELNTNHIRTAYTVSVVLGLVFFVLCFLTAPIIASFFKIDELSIVLKFLSIIFILNGLSIISEALISRNLMFNKLVRVQVISYIVYGSISSMLGFLGFGVWALAIGQVSQVMTKMIMCNLLYRHDKKLVIKVKELKELLYFSGGFSIGKINNQIALQGDNIMVGRTLGPEQLGLYGRAYELITMPATLFGKTLDKVLFPAMSAIQNNNKKLSKVYLNGISLTSILVMPISVILFLSSNEIILLLFGSQWEGVSEPFGILVLALYFRTGYKISDSLVRAKGAVYLRAWRQGIYAFLVIMGSYIGHFYGVVGVSLGVSIAIVINYILMAVLSINLIKIKKADFLLSHKNGLVLSILIYVLFSVANILIPTTPYVVIDLIITLFSSILPLVLLILIRNIGFYIIGKEGYWLINELKKRFKK